MYCLHRQGRRVYNARTMTLCWLHGYCLFVLLIDPDDGCRMYLWNFGKLLSNYTAKLRSKIIVGLIVTAMRNSNVCLIALTSPTSGGRSDSIVWSWTQTTEFVCLSRNSYWVTNRMTDKPGLNSSLRQEIYNSSWRAWGHQALYSTGTVYCLTVGKAAGSWSLPLIPT
jgi:hypothetical protein